MAETLSKFGCYEDEKSNRDSTTLLADRHFDHPVSENRYCSTFVMDTEVIVADSGPLFRPLFCGGLMVLLGIELIIEGI